MAGVGTMMPTIENLGNLYDLNFGHSEQVIKETKFFISTFENERGGDYVAIQKALEKVNMYNEVMDNFLKRVTIVDDITNSAKEMTGSLKEFISKEKDSESKRQKTNRRQRN